jgi:hypothetical protein
MLILGLAISTRHSATGSSAFDMPPAAWSVAISEWHGAQAAFPTKPPSPPAAACAASAAGSRPPGTPDESQSPPAAQSAA